MLTAHLKHRSPNIFPSKKKKQSPIIPKMLYSCFIDITIGAWSVDRPPYRSKEKHLTWLKKQRRWAALQRSGSLRLQPHFQKQLVYDHKGTKLNPRRKAWKRSHLSLWLCVFLVSSAQTHKSKQLLPSGVGKGCGTVDLYVRRSIW